MMPIIINIIIIIIIIVIIIIIIIVIIIIIISVGLHYVLQLNRETLQVLRPGSIRYGW